MRARIPLLFFGILLVGLLFALGCSSESDGGTGPNQVSRQVKLTAARARWEGAGIDDYVWTVRRGCFCHVDFNRPALIRVENGIKTSVTDIQTGEPVDESSWQFYPTVEELFGVIQAAIDRGAYQLDTSYHSGLGYPHEVYIDQARQMVDEEQTYEGSGLQPE